MRGFPLLNALVVVAIFAMAWWPLQKTVADREPAAEDLNLEGVELADTSPESLQSPTVLSVISTETIGTIRIEHLGEPIFEGRNSNRFEHLVDHLPIPAEGTDLWIEATFSEDVPEKQAAIRIQLETSFGELIERTMWGEGSSISDSVYFTPSNP